MTDCLYVPVPSHGSLTGERIESCGFREKLPLLVVHGELRGDVRCAPRRALLGACAVRALEPLGDLAMPNANGCRRAAGERGILEQRVYEAVARLDRAVRPCLGPEVPEQSLFVRQRLAARIDVVHRRID